MNLVSATLTSSAGFEFTIGENQMRLCFPSITFLRFSSLVCKSPLFVVTLWPNMSFICGEKVSKLTVGSGLPHNGGGVLNHLWISKVVNIVWSLHLLLPLFLNFMMHRLPKINIKNSVRITEFFIIYTSNSVLFLLSSSGHDCLMDRVIKVFGKLCGVLLVWGWMNLLWLVSVKLFCLKQTADGIYI